MTDIAYFIYCESIEEMQNGSMSIKNPYMIMTPLFIPGMYSYSIALAIRNVKKEGNELQIILKNEGGEIVNDAGIIKLPPIEENAGNGSELHGIQMSIDFLNVPFKEQGYYCSEVILNGECIGNFSILVKQAGVKDDDNTRAELPS